MEKLNKHLTVERVGERSFVLVETLSGETLGEINITLDEIRALGRFAHKEDTSEASQTRRNTHAMRSIGSPKDANISGAPCAGFKPPTSTTGGNLKAVDNEKALSVGKKLSDFDISSYILQGKYGQHKRETLINAILKNPTKHRKLITKCREGLLGIELKTTFPKPTTRTNATRQPNKTPQTADEIFADMFD